MKNSEIIREAEDNFKISLAHCVDCKFSIPAFEEKEDGLQYTGLTCTFLDFHVGPEDYCLEGERSKNKVGVFRFEKEDS